MGLQANLAIGFVVVISILLYLKRDKIKFQPILGPLVYFIMYKSSWGLRGMDAVASRLRKPLKYFAYIGVVVGFAGMAWISYELVKGTILLVTQPSLTPGIQPVLPIQAKGVFYVPFIFWIVSIFVIAAVHEFSHGVIARVHNMKVKSSGFAFLGVLLPIIPAAFVEPDEKEVAKSSAWQQLSMFAAGPFSNIVFAFLIIFLLGFSIPPLIPEKVTDATTVFDFAGFSQSLIEIEGLRVVDVVDGAPAFIAGIPQDVLFTAVNGVSVADDAFPAILDGLKAGEKVALTTDKEVYSFVLGPHPSDAAKGYMGLSFQPETSTSAAAIEKYGEAGTQSILFLSNLLLWIIILSLGIGLFNLLPLGPIDGGRMLHTLTSRVFTDKVGHQVWKVTSFFFLALIIVNLAAGFLA